MYHLSLYVIAGFGHIKPATALTEQFSRKHKIKGKTWDIFSPDGLPAPEASNLYNNISRSSILSPIWNLATRHDLLPAWLFYPFHAWEVLTGKKTIQKLRKLDKKHPNTIITATHPTPALLAAKARPEKTIFLYVTDIHPHGLWKLSPKNIHYLVPMEETKIDLTRYGIPSERISLASFPIHQELLDNHASRFKKRLAILSKKNLKTIDVLVISGGAGTGKKEMQDLISRFSVPAKAAQVRLTFLVSTPKLEKSLIGHCVECQTRKNQILVKRYTPHSLYPALKKAEILITKAGGDVTFEALAEGVPIYTLKDVGDHERLNRQYLELIGASKPLFYTKTPWDLIQSDILTGEIKLMTRASNEHGKFHRQATTPTLILNLLKS